MSDLRADIEAAMKSVDDGVMPDPIENQSDIIPTDEAPPPEIDGAKSPEAEAKSRDESGKFKSKPKEAAPKEGKQPQAGKEAAPVDPAAPKETPAEKNAEEIAPPKGWRGSAKVQWNKLPAAVREEILADHKRVGEQEAQYGGLSRVIEPHRTALTAAYGSVENAVSQLFATWDVAKKDPAGFLVEFAKISNVDLRRLIPQAGSAPQASLHPDATVSALQAQVAQLTNQLGQFATQHRQNADAPYISQVESFASDATNNPFFNDVREDMALLMGNGRAKTLKEAYDMACNMRPDIRAQIAMQEGERAEAERRSKAVQARAAAASVTGTPLANVATDIPIGNSLREDIVNAMRAHGGYRV